MIDPHDTEMWLTNSQGADGSCTHGTERMTTCHGANDHTVVVCKYPSGLRVQPPAQ